jgi:hypothetical protein
VDSSSDCKCGSLGVGVVLVRLIGLMRLVYGNL